MRLDVVRPRLHQASASMLRQLWDDASDSTPIENNGVIPKWVATLLWSNFGFKWEHYCKHHQSCRSVDADAWSKRTLILMSVDFFKIQFVIGKDKRSVKSLQHWVCISVDDFTTQDLLGPLNEIVMLGG